MPRAAGSPGRSAAHPTFSGAARSSLHAAGRWVQLLAGGPGRRSRLRAAQVALGTAVAAHLPDELAPTFLAEPLARRRAIEAQLAGHRAQDGGTGQAQAGGTGGIQAGTERAQATGRSAGSGPTAAERLLRAPDVAATNVSNRLARRRLKTVDAQLGAWATGLVDLPLPQLEATRRVADRAQQHAAGAAAELAASRRVALTSAGLAVVLAVEAVAGFVLYVAAAIAAGAGVIWSWLASAWSATVGGLAAAWSAVTSRLARAARRRRRPPRAAAGRGGRHAVSTGGGLEGAAHGVWTAGDQAGGGRPGRHERDRSGWADATEGAGGPGGGGRDAGPSRPGGEAAGAGTAGPSGGAGYWWAPAGPQEPAEPAAVRPARQADAAAWTPAGAGSAEDAPAWIPARPDEVGDTAAWTPGWSAAGHDGAAPAPRPRDPVLAGLGRVAGLPARVVRRFGRWTASWLAPVVVAVAAPPNRARRPWLGLFRPIAAACVLSLVIGMFTALPTGMVMAGSVKAAGRGLPDLADLRPLDQPERTEVYDVNGKLIEVLKSEQDRIVVPLAAVPVLVQNAVVAAEDARFYDHRGVDQRGIMRALFADIAEGARSQGGSTITQQLVRNAYPHLKERSLARKVREAALAAELERRTSKPKILEQYLNRVYFGGGYYGVEAASRGYFARRVGQLSLAQAATLAGIIRSPETANPRTSPKEALHLRNTVLDRMVELGMVPADAAARARGEPLGVRARPSLPNGRYRWFMDGVKRQLLDDPRLGRTPKEREKKLFQGGLRVFTTLNPEIQQAAERAVAERGPSTGPDVALVAMIPSTGAVRAVVGGRDRARGRFNLALQAHRQPGSSFKPFVLASALENGISPDSLWDTSGWSLRQVCGAPWKVDNYEGKGGGLMPVRTATWFSVNGVYGRLMEQLCPDKVVDMARRLGVRIDKKQQKAPSIALGSANVYPIDMAAAYATFANMGVRQEPNFVTKVIRHGQVLFENKPTGQQVIPPALAYEVNDVLKGVIDHGTARSAQIGRPASGKTGTTQDYRDAWFVGYTPQLATAVWMGYSRKEEPMLDVQGISRVTGGSLPANIWQHFMQEALAGTAPTDWQRPPETLQYTVLPPPPTTTTTIPGPPPGTTLPGQTVPPSTKKEGAPTEPRRSAAGRQGGRRYHRQRRK